MSSVECTCSTKLERKPSSPESFNGSGTIGDRRRRPVTPLKLNTPSLEESHQLQFQRLKFLWLTMAGDLASVTKAVNTMDSSSGPQLKQVQQHAVFLKDLLQILTSVSSHRLLQLYRWTIDYVVHIAVGFPWQFRGLGFRVYYNTDTFFAF